MHQRLACRFRVRVWSACLCLCALNAAVAEDVCSVASPSKLLAADGAANDAYGESVAISGNTIVIGSSGHDEPELNNGAAYIYVHTAGGWAPQAKLVADTTDLFADRFGFSVAIDGDTVVVGAPLNSETLEAQEGASFVYVRSGSTWSLQARLVPSQHQGGGGFGWKVAIRGSVAVVSAINDSGMSTGFGSGSAYVFERSGTIWTEVAHLTAGDAHFTDGFGAAVAIESDSIIVGTQSKNAAYVFVRSGATWIQQAKLTPANPAGVFGFGNSVSIHGDTAFIGAGADGAVGIGAGSAFVFERSGVTWTQRARLLALDGAASDGAGSSVWFDGTYAVIGSPGHDGAGAEMGAAYVYARRGDGWAFQMRILPPAASSQARFGRSVSIGGQMVVIGMDQDDDNGNNAGAAYAYTLDPCEATCAPADVNCDGVVNGLDIQGFISSVLAN